LGGEGVGEGGRGAAAGARLVLGDDGRIAGDEAIEVPRDHAGIDVVAAADVAADDEIDGLAGVEIRGVDRGDRKPREHCCRSQSAARPRSAPRHCAAPLALTLSYRTMTVIAADCAVPTCRRPPS